MALASTTWDDFSPGRPAWSATRRRQTSTGNAAALGALTALCTVAAAIAALHALNLSPLRLHHDIVSAPAPLPLAAPVRHVAPIPMPRPIFQRNAQEFLQDSLRLTESCGFGCADIVAEVTEAQKLGHFGASRAPLRTALPLGQRFEPPAEVAPKADRVVAEVAPPRQPLATASVQVASPVQVPLPSTMPAAAPEAIEAPLPAPRPNRAADTGGLATLAQPLEEVAPPLGERAAPPVSAPALSRTDGVAIYDISAHTVYLPDGTHLEAHSGLGSMVDNPRYVDRRNIGSTPPGTYKLQALDSLFHGVEALRMVPVDSKTRYGRDGFLTHTYMLRGRPGQSNGCVVFPNYGRFLSAFKRGHVRRLVVVASLKGSSMQVAAAGN